MDIDPTSSKFRQNPRPSTSANFRNQSINRVFQNKDRESNNPFRSFDKNQRVNHVLVNNNNTSNPNEVRNDQIYYLLSLKKKT